MVPIVGMALVALSLGLAQVASGLGNITTVARTGVADFSGDGGPATSGRIAAGAFVVIDVSGGTCASSYPVEYKSTIDVTLDTYKTDSIVLRELPDGVGSTLRPADINAV